MITKIKILAGVLTIFILIGGILTWQYWALKEEVKQLKEVCREKTLCRVYDSSSNERIKTDKVRIQVKEIEGISAIYSTNKNGEIYIPFDRGITYQITVDYRNSSKTVTLKYNGWGNLTIQLNQDKNSVESISFSVMIRNPIE